MKHRCWPAKTIEEIAQVKSGKRLPKGHTLIDAPTNHPYLRLVDIHGNRIRGDNIQYLDNKTFDCISRYIVNTNDVCLAIVGHTIGLVFYVDQQWDHVNLTENAARITSFDGVDSRYLFYYLSSNEGQQEIKSRTVGSAQGKLPLYQIRSMEVPVPPISEQHAIAHILRTLDDKIELNHRMNETLEAMARAIFKSWFVDFDPVRAKAEGRQPEGMDAETAALFPDGFEDSELGEIPRGWKVEMLQSFSQLNPESWTKNNSPESVWYIDLANVKSGTIEEVQCFPFADAPSRARRILHCGDTIVGTVRPGNKSYALIKESDKRLTGSTGFAVLRPRVPEYTEFLYLAATSPENIEHLAHVADGAAYPAVRPNVVHELPAMVSSDEIMSKFHQITSPLLKLYWDNNKENNLLASIRDTLLPKLLSGEIRVKDAGKAVDAVT